MVAESPKREVTLPDPHPADGSPLRPALWHAAALAAAGYRVAAHEFKHDTSGNCWRTWHLSEAPIRPTGDPVLCSGSASLMSAYDTGRLLRETPRSPYLAAYYGARNLDILLAYRERGGATPVCVAISPGRSPIASMVPPTARAEIVSLAEMIRGQHQSIRIGDPCLAAAAITLGFPLDGMEGAAANIMLAAAVDPAGGLLPIQYGGSVTCEGLPLGAAVAAYRSLVEQHSRASKLVVADGSADPPLESPLDPSHLFHWAAAGAMRRQALRAVEYTLGHDASKLRSHIIQGRRRMPGHAVIATQAEFEANESRIVAHLRKF